MTDSTVNRFVGYGTTTQMNAFTPSPPTPASGPSQGYLWGNHTTQSVWYYDFTSNSWVEPSGGGGTPGGSNGQVQYNDSGTFGGLALNPFLPPTASGFSTFSGDGTSPTFTNVAGLGAVMDTGSVTTSDIIRGATKATPGADYTVSANLLTTLLPSNYRNWSLLISDGTKIIIFGYSYQNPIAGLIAQYNSDSSGIGSFQNFNAPPIYSYLQFKNNGTTRFYNASMDGTNWVTIFSEAAGTFLTETEYGIGSRVISSGAASDHIFITCPWLTATSP